MAFVAQSNTGIVTEKSFSMLYSRLFDKIVVDSSDVLVELKEFFTEETTHLETMRIGSINSVLGLPIKRTDTEPIPLANPTEGHQKEFTNVIYALGFVITRSAISRQKTRLLLSAMNGLPNAAKQKEALMYANMLNGAFATHTTGDGAYIFSASHNDGDAEIGSYTNLATPAGFTTDSYFLAWQNFQNRVNAKGFAKPMEIGEVVFPVALAEDVGKVLKSSKYGQNSLNAEVPDFLKNFTPVVFHNSTSNTQWFVHAKVKDADKGLTMVWEDKPNYLPLSFPDNPDIVMGRRLRMAMSCGAVHAKDWYGNAGV